MVLLYYILEYVNIERRQQKSTHHCTLQKTRFPSFPPTTPPTIKEKYQNHGFCTLFPYYSSHTFMLQILIEPRNFNLFSLCRRGKPFFEEAISLIFQFQTKAPSANVSRVQNVVGSRHKSRQQVKHH